MLIFAPELRGHGECVLWDTNLLCCLLCAHLRRFASPSQHQVATLWQKTSAAAAATGARQCWACLSPGKEVWALVSYMQRSSCPYCYSMMDH